MINRTFWSDYTLSETDPYTVIIVRRLESQFDATQLEIDDTRFLSCLSVVPLAMEATVICYMVHSVSVSGVSED